MVIPQKSRAGGQVGGESVVREEKKEVRNDEKWGLEQEEPGTRLLDSSKELVCVCCYVVLRCVVYVFRERCNWKISSSAS